MVLPLAPAFASQYYEQPPSRPGTAFEAYLRNRQHDKSPQPPQAVSAATLRQEVDPLQPVHLHTSQGVATCFQQSTGQGPSSPPTSRQRPASQSHSTPRKGEYSSLADAAAGLAAAARSLASKPGTSGAEAGAVQASFNALAAAAQELAVNVTAHRAASAREGKRKHPTAQPDTVAQPVAAVASLQAVAISSRDHQPFSNSSGRPLSTPPQEPKRRPPLQPDHNTTAQQAGAQQAAAAQLAAAQQGLLAAAAATSQGREAATSSSQLTAGRPPLTPTPRQGGDNLPAPFSSTSGRPVVTPGRTSTPPLLPCQPAGGPHLLRPAQAGHRDKQHHGPGGQAGHCQPHHTQHGRATGQRPHHAGSGQRPRRDGPVTPGPGDKGSTVAQIFTLPGGAGGDSTGSSKETGQAPSTVYTGALQDPVDPILLYMAHPELVRVDRWPPPSPITTAQLSEDRTARAVNGMLASLRERVATQGSHAVLRCFKLQDVDGSGALDIEEFRKVLLGLNLAQTGPTDKVLSLLMQGLDGNHDGRINYNEFVAAVKFNKLPYMPYNSKFRHRTAGDPDQPFGNTSVNFPYGTVSDGEANNLSCKAKMDATFQELRAAFKEADTDEDGLVNRSEFASVMRKLDEQHRLRLDANYIQQIFRDTDLDYSGGVDYEQFLSAFAGSANSRFVPEFLLPQSLRCSQLGAPWEWHTSPQPGGRRTGALAPPLTACSTKQLVDQATWPTAAGTTSFKDSQRPSIRVFPQQTGPPATPLILPGSRLLRSLQAGGV